VPRGGIATALPALAQAQAARRWELPFSTAPSERRGVEAVGPMTVWPKPQILLHAERAGERPQKLAHRHAIEAGQLRLGHHVLVLDAGQRAGGVDQQPARLAEPRE